MEIKEGIFYTESHEWVKVEDNTAYIGITDFAQDALGEIVFVELPMEGEEFAQKEAIGVIESVKAVSDLYVPVGGEILESNEDLYDAPEELNNAPYESWMIAVDLADESQLDDLMSAEEYENFCKEEEE
ncbi:glycine cleavage system protein GcvH [Natroniella sulfidigena]|uniref:glycine cleavage system protein GcvH n=1 Tax=Natroniella sulfidigena TaxID=723921 RepID=UPI00200ADAF5|nr:glycine cleavage system protein GcvH [Natroniella sulfidigena]MCK8817737.1 glycine cleavage system protein GcvH [Natroniella sulfidigena]